MITRQDSTIDTPKPTLYLYNLVFKSQYNNSEFKGLLIDSEAVTQSTGGISQLKALQQLDNTIRLDKTIADSADFVFGIGNTPTIGTIQLSTPMSMVTFYIVEVVIFFLLCLADMD